MLRSGGCLNWCCVLVLILAVGAETVNAGDGHDPSPPMTLSRKTVPVVMSVPPGFTSQWRQLESAWRASLSGSSHEHKLAMMPVFVR